MYPLGARMKCIFLCMQSRVVMTHVHITAQSAMNAVGTTSAMANVMHPSGAKRTLSAMAEVEEPGTPLCAVQCECAHCEHHVIHAHVYMCTKEQH